MLDTIFCLGFVLLLLFWVIGRGISTPEHYNSNIQDYSTSSYGEAPEMSMDPTNLDDPANMAMWMELGEL